MRRSIGILVMLMFVMSWGLHGCSIRIPSPSDRIDLREYCVKKAEGTRDKILLIPLSGIVTSSSERGLFSRSANMVEELGMQLEKASKDERIKGVIINVSSPGGEVTASEIIYHKLMRFKKEKGVPVVVLMGDVAASGAYYISTAADRIVAHESTITGSIGVISIVPNVEGLMGKIGVSVETLKTGEM